MTFCLFQLRLHQRNVFQMDLNIHLYIQVTLAGLERLRRSARVGAARRTELSQDFRAARTSSRYRHRGECHVMIVVSKLLSCSERHLHLQRCIFCSGARLPYSILQFATVSFSCKLFIYQFLHEQHCVYVLWVSCVNVSMTVTQCARV